MNTFQFHCDSLRTLSVFTDTITLETTASPHALCLKNETPFPIGMADLQQVGRFTTCTSFGNLDNTVYRAAAPDGFSMTVRVGRIRRYESFTIAASFYNGTDQPVRLREFTLLEGNLTCKGDPANWWLSTMEHDMHVGSLADRLISRNDATRIMWESFQLPLPSALPETETANDGRWRTYGDYLTLYGTDSPEGLCIGPCGSPNADLVHECFVDNGQVFLRIKSAMTDILVEPGQTRESQEVMLVFGEYRESLETILRAVADTHGSRTHKAPLHGWCSWYDLFANVTEENIHQTVAAFAAMGDSYHPQLIQIDDGWQKTAGDWTANEKFPHGMAALASEITKVGAIPGIWIAPLAMHDSLPVLREHPDWLQRGAHGELLGEAGNWGSSSFWLDPTHPDVQTFLRDTIRRLRQDGYRYFKIDFNTLDASCRYHNPYKTRLQAYRDLYRLYREELGEDCYLLSCSGFTRGTVGYADSSRIGPDVAPNWKAETHPISALEGIRATGMSALANKLFYSNDPDVFYLKSRFEGEGVNPFNQTECETWLSFVSLLGGLSLTSDAIYKPTYEPALPMLAAVCPPPPEKGLVFPGGTRRDPVQFGYVSSRPWGDSASVALWNVSDNPSTRTLDLRGLEILGPRYHVWSYWENAYKGIFEAGYETELLPPHGTALLRLTPVDELGRIQLIGSSLHLSMGASEVAAYRATDRSAQIVLSCGGKDTGELTVFSRRPVTLQDADGCCVSAITQTAPSVYVLQITHRDKQKAQTITLRADG